MKNLKTIILIMGVLVAALALNTSLAQTKQNTDKETKADVWVDEQVRVKPILREKHHEKVKSKPVVKTEMKSHKLQQKQTKMKLKSKIKTQRKMAKIGKPLR